MTRMNVGVLRGGDSSEYDSSLKTGSAIISSLPEEHYLTRDVFIDKRGTWHMRGIPAEPARALAQLDVVVNGLHGGSGEDGTVARIIERAGVPYTGSRPYPSALSLNKILARETFKEWKIRIPQGVWFTLGDANTVEDMARAAFSFFGPPYVVKPPKQGASIGILLADTIGELPDELEQVLNEYGAALVEQFIVGRQASVGVIEGFRGEELYALPPVEIVLPKNLRIIEPILHEMQLLEHRAPGRFDRFIKAEMMEAAKSAHRALGLSHYSRADFIVTPRNAYLLEVNALPGLYSGAAFPEMLESVGSSLPDFLSHVVRMAAH